MAPRRSGYAIRSPGSWEVARLPFLPRLAPQPAPLQPTCLQAGSRPRPRHLPRSTPGVLCPRTPAREALPRTHSGPCRPSETQDPWATAPGEPAAAARIRSKTPQLMCHRTTRGDPAGSPAHRDRRTALAARARAPDHARRAATPVSPRRAPLPAGTRDPSRSGPGRTKATPPARPAAAPRSSARAHLGSVPGGGGGGSSAGLRRRGPGGGGDDNNPGGRPEACGALGRRGPVQRRRRRLRSRRGRRRWRGRVGGGASRQVQVRPRRRRDAPSSSRPRAGRRLRHGPGSPAAAGVGARRSAGCAPTASGSGGPAAAAAGARRGRGRPCQGRRGRPRRCSGLRSGGAGGGGCGSPGRRAEVRSCHRCQLPPRSSLIAPL